MCLLIGLNWSWQQQIGSGNQHFMLALLTIFQKKEVHHICTTVRTKEMKTFQCLRIFQLISYTFKSFKTWAGPCLQVNLLNKIRQLSLITPEHSGSSRTDRFARAPMCVCAQRTCQGSTRTVQSWVRPPEISADTGWHSCPCWLCPRAVPLCDASSLENITWNRSL